MESARQEGSENRLPQKLDFVMLTHLDDGRPATPRTQGLRTLYVSHVEREALVRTIEVVRGYKKRIREIGVENKRLKSEIWNNELKVYNQIELNNAKYRYDLEVNSLESELVGARKFMELQSRNDRAEYIKDIETRLDEARKNQEKCVGEDECITESQLREALMPVEVYEDRVAKTMDSAGPI